MKYPQIKAEDVVFREQFINNQYVADNGATVVGSPTISNGVTLNGTSQYLTYNGKFLETHQNLTIEISFAPDFAYDEDVIRILFDSPASHRYSVIKFDNAGSNVLRVNLGNTALDIASATYSTYWNVGGKNHLMVCADGTNTSVYLNNNVIANETAHSWTPKVPTTVYIGSNNGGVQWFDGQIRAVNAYNRKYTAAEVADRFAQTTFTEPTPENSEMWLPLRSYYHDGTRNVTPNLGNMNDFKWGDGGGNNEPTLRSPNGALFNGTDSYIAGNPINAAATNSVLTVSALITISAIGAVNMIAMNQLNWLFAIWTNGKLTLQFRDAGGGYHRLAYSTTILRASQSCHVAAVYDGSDSANGISLYVNGVKEVNTSTNWDAGVSGTSTRSTIGISVDDLTSFPFGGAILFPIIFKAALTPTQIKWLAGRAQRELNL